VSLRFSCVSFSDRYALAVVDGRRRLHPDARRHEAGLEHRTLCFCICVRDAQSFPGVCDFIQTHAVVNQVPALVPFTTRMRDASSFGVHNH
jgi:hypothetical protein